jgi:hypothetical protein
MEIGLFKFPQRMHVGEKTVPSETTARIQKMHITLGQMLCGALEVELGLVAPD